MKSYSLLLLSLSLLLFGCGERSSSDQLVVSGKILKVKAHHAFLEALGFNSPNPQILDSVSVKDDGSYTLKTINKGESLYRLVIDNDYQVIFVNDNNHITINIDPANDRHPDIEGSPASTDLYTFLNNYAAKDSAIDATKVLIDSLNNRETPIKKQDSIINSLQNQRKNYLADINTLIKNFLQRTTSPAAAAYVIVQGTKSMQPEELLPLAEATAKKYPDNSSLAALMGLLKINSADQASNNYPLLGKQAPDLSMEDPNGKTLRISQFRGKYLLVDFWASWCGPCREENPNVVAAYQKYKNKNFTILGVSLDKEKASWIQAIKADKLDWNQMSDLKFWDSEAVNAYHFEGIPFNVLIDPNGKIIASSLRGNDLDKKLAEVLK